MKSLFLLSAVTVSAISTLGAEESKMSIEQTKESACKHFISPKFFYRIHDELGYDYKMTGLGFEYKYMQKSGINVSASLITNLSNKQPLVEDEIGLSYNFPIGKSFTLYPLVSYRMGTHRMDKKINAAYFISKGISYAGIGIKTEIIPNFEVYAEAMGFKDICNLAMVKVEHSFYGQHFSNPHGLKGKLGLQYLIFPNAMVSIEGNYAKTFPKEYWEAGAQLAASMGF